MSFLLDQYSALTARPHMKMQRALATIQNLAADIESWQLDNAECVTGQVSDAGNSISYILKSLPKEPELWRWSERVASAIKFMREALDSLIWNYCTLDGEEPENRNLVNFPIMSRRKRWKDTRKTLSKLPETVLARIQQMQPFENPDKMVPQFLLGIADFTNTDKHRTPIDVYLRSLSHVKFGVSFESREPITIPANETVVIGGFDLHPLPQYNEWEPGMNLLSTAPKTVVSSAYGFVKLPAEPAVAALIADGERSEYGVVDYLFLAYQCVDHVIGVVAANPTDNLDVDTITLPPDVGARTEEEIEWEEVEARENDTK